MRNMKNNKKEEDLQCCANELLQDYKVVQSNKTRWVNILSFFVVVLLFAGFISFYIVFNKDVQVSIYLSADMGSTILELDRKSTIGDIEVVDKEGYRFVGWYKDTEHLEAYNEYEKLKSGMVIYAKYEIITFDISYPTNPAYTIFGDSIINYGENLSFTITPNIGYTDSIFQVFANNEIIYQIDGVYTLENIEQDIAISIIGGVKNTYAVTFPTNTTGYIIDCENMVITHGEKLSFNISMQRGYENKSPIITANGNILIATNVENNVYYFEISNIQNTIAINVSNVELNEYSVSKSTGNGYVIRTNNNVITHGNNLLFNVELLNGYTDSNFIVTINGEVINAKNIIENIYYFELNNIQSTTHINVSNVVLNQYSVSASAGNGYVIQTNNNVITHGNNLLFEVELLNGYTDSNLEVSINGEVINAKNIVDNIYYYELNNIQSTTHINVSNVVLNQYSVSASTGNEYVIRTNSNVITHGNSLLFEVELLNGYTNSDLNVTINGVNINYYNVVGDKYYYRVYNIENNVSILVSDVVENNYSITWILRDLGYTVSNTSEKVSHFSYIEFYLNILSGYNDDNLVITTSNGKLEKIDNNYKLSEVSYDPIITISGVAINVYGIVFPENFVGYVISYEKENCDYGSSFDFDITILNGYTDSVPNVLVKESVLAPIRINENTYHYTISNITESYHVKVENIVLNTYYISYPNSDKYTIQNPTTATSHGNNAIFTLILNEGYNINNVVVNASSGVVSKNGLNYTILNITNDCVITIDNIELNEYNVVFENEENGYVLSYSSLKVTFGESYTFNVQLSEGYTNSGITLSINGVVCSAKSIVENCYTYEINNVKNDINVVINGVTLNTYNIQFVNEFIGYSITNVPTSIEYGKSINFTIIVENGYIYDNLLVLSSEGLKSNVGLNYTISSIKNNAEITISGIEKLPEEYTLNTYVDGVLSSFTVIENDTLCDTGLLSENECVGWYSDPNFVNYVSMSTMYSDIVNNGTITLYTKCATLDKLNFLLNENNTYSVSALSDEIEGAVIIPRCYNNKLVTEVGSFAFTMITSVFIPDGVHTITSDAFNESLVENIRVGFGVRNIGSNAFMCSMIQSIFIPSSVESILADDVTMSPFFYADCIIYTNANSNNWGEFWYFSDEGMELIVEYGISYIDYLDIIA